MPADGFRPILTDVQGYAADLLRKLRCVRHNQIHWLIGRVYPDVTPETGATGVRHWPHNTLQDIKERET